jgi:hypothetical protein
MNFDPKQLGNLSQQTGTELFEVNHTVEQLDKTDEAY